MALWLNQQPRTFDPRLLADLFAQTVQALLQEIHGLGEIVSFDVTHISAHVKENNRCQYVKDRYNPNLQLMAIVFCCFDGLGFCLGAECCPFCRSVLSFSRGLCCSVTPVGPPTLPGTKLRVARNSGVTTPHG